ncbi:MAG: hypothetical protein FJ316_07215 [SAR202 cluster bacterium]|nr:hypothetical protein [SAR202 cluster bacterium]
MGRKDRERFLRMKQQDPDYSGFRGITATPAKPAEATESVTCSVCRRKRNVPVSSIPVDRERFVCLQCQERQPAAGI